MVLRRKASSVGVWKTVFHPAGEGPDCKGKGVTAMFRIKDVTSVSMGQILEEQAKKYRSKVIVHCEDQHITYDEFNEKTNRLANGLLSLGVQKG